jgi:hypothetical protein
MKESIDFTHEQYNRRIDLALQRLGSADPARGLEGRISARLAREEAASLRAPRSFSLPRFAFATMAAAVACVAIIAGSVNHSRRILPTAPGIQLPAGPSSGLGAASAAHVATRPVAPSPNERPRSMRKTVNGRAVISPEAQKPAGVAVPKNPAPQSEAPSQQ